MEADRDRHRFDAQVVDTRRDFQHAVAEAVRHLDRVGEWKLPHPRWMLEKFQLAGNPRRLTICAHVGDFPLGRRCQKPVDRVRSANVSQRHVERVAFAVRIKRLLIEPVGPWRKEGNADRAGASFVLGGRFEGETKDVVSLHFHFDGEIAERWNN
jgi:hypothetical protein